MDILKAILDIEKKAQGIVNEADKIKKQENEKTEKALSELEEKAKAEVKIRLAEISDNIEKELKTEFSQSSQGFQNRLSAMEKYFEENMPYWIETITKNIIKGDV